MLVCSHESGDVWQLISCDFFVLSVVCYVILARKTQKLDTRILLCRGTIISIGNIGNLGRNMAKIEDTTILDNTQIREG